MNITRDPSSSESDAPTPLISNCLPKHATIPLLELPEQAFPKKVARFSSPHAEPIIMTRPLSSSSLRSNTSLSIYGQEKRKRPPLSFPTITAATTITSDYVYQHSSLPLALVVSTVANVTGCLVGLAIRRLLYQILHFREVRLLSSTAAADGRREDSSTTVMSGDRRVRGIPNYGQTCFLNSVLQSLAALEPFVAYVERIDAARKREFDDWEAVLGNDESLTRCLVDLLHSINGLKVSSPVTIDPRPALAIVAEKHSQFRAKIGMGRSSIGREQQDAEELLQALIGIVVEDAELDSTPSATQATFILEDYKVDNDSEDEDDEILTVVSGIRERIRTNEKSTCSKVDTNGNGTTSNIHASSQSPSLQDEKKQDELYAMNNGSVEDFNDILFQPMPKESIDTANGSTIVPPVSDLSSKEQQLSSAMRMMITSTSSITPSPLCGWIGSALQCRTCKHVRPIQNAPFLDIPLVPIAVSRHLSSVYGRNHGPPEKYSGLHHGPPCTLEQCFEEFTSVERVQDVECRSCTLRGAITDLEEEALFLRGGIETLIAKAQKQNRYSSQSEATSGQEDPAKHLRYELERIERKLGQLQLTSPDEEGVMEKILCKDEAALDGDDFLPEMRILRSDAFKCLLLTRLPSVLCIHIQRRFYDPLTNRMSKTGQHVIFPEILNIGPFCAYGGAFGPDAEWAGTAANTRNHKSNLPIAYRLMAAIEHSGDAFAGHYVAYRRDTESGGWLYISDDRVRKIGWADVRNCQAYMLFYEAL